MAAKRLRRALWPRSDDSKKLGRSGGNEGSDDDDEEESGRSGEDAVPAEPKEMPLKRAEDRPPPSPEDAGAQGSGEASPARGGVASKTKTTPSKRVKKRPRPVEHSGDALSARVPLPDGTSDAGHSKRAATTPKRGEKRSLLPREGDERPRPEKRAAGPAGEAVAASSPRRKKDRRKKKKKKQLRRALTKPTSPNQLLELELNGNREDTPSSPEIAQEDEHHGRELAEQEPSNTSPPQDEAAEHQEKKIAEQEHAGGTSPPHDKDMHSAHGEEQQEEVADQEHADDTLPSPPKDNHSVDEEEQPKDTSLLQEKKPAAERSWSYDDELKILNALVEHAQSHDGALPDSSHLLENLTFDKIDANEDKLTDKIRKLRTRYRKMLSQGYPSDRLARRLFKLSERLWGQVDEDEQLEPTSSRDFSALSKLYPHLAKEVKAYTEAHGSGDLIMAMFMNIGHEKARDLDAKCKKLQIEAFKLELGQASLINELLSALSSLTRVKF